jgi:hypothetical protein
MAKRPKGGSQNNLENYLAASRSADAVRAQWADNKLASAVEKGVTRNELPWRVEVVDANTIRLVRFFVDGDGIADILEMARSRFDYEVKYGEVKING